ncbi:AMP-binding protein, partial [Streptomyces sp. DT17]
TGTVGRVLPHIEVKVVVPVTGVTLPRGEAGAQRTRGYSVRLGDREAPARTAAARDAGRGMRPGDLAGRREAGYGEI